MDPTEHERTWYNTIIRFINHYNHFIYFYLPHSALVRLLIVRSYFFQFLSVLKIITVLYMTTATTTCLTLPAIFETLTMTELLLFTLQSDFSGLAPFYAAWCHWVERCHHKFHVVRLAPPHFFTPALKNERTHVSSISLHALLSCVLTHLTAPPPPATASPPHDARRTVGSVRPQRVHGGQRQRVRLRRLGRQPNAQRPPRPPHRFVAP